MRSGGPVAAAPARLRIPATLRRVDRWIRAESGQQMRFFAVGVPQKLAEQRVGPGKPGADPGQGKNFVNGTVRISSII